MLTPVKYLLNYIYPVENPMFLANFNAEIMPKDFFNHLIDLYWSPIGKESTSLSLLIAWGQRVHYWGSALCLKFSLCFYFSSPGELQSTEIVFCMLLSNVMHFGEKPNFRILLHRAHEKKKVCEKYLKKGKRFCVCFIHYCIYLSNVL